MSGFGALAENIKKLDSDKIFKKIFSDPALQRWILDQPKNRIQDTGINSDGKKLQTDKASAGNPYSNATMDIYDGLGLQINHVDLTVTGDFWNSQRFILKNDGFETTANYIKDGKHIGENFLSEYSRAEFWQTTSGLNEQELNELTIKVFDKYIKEIDEIL
jgi:hypothetical protein